MNDYSFGNFIYQLRNEKGYSQSELGQMLGVTNKAVSKWENGSAKPNTSLIPKIAEILGVTVEELFACRRLQKDGELQKLKTHLGLLKKKYAVLSSAYLSILITVPLWLILFITVVMGFKIDDEILGPLGSVTFIVLFIVSLVSYIIYQKNYKAVWTKNPPELTKSFMKRIELWKQISGIVFVVCCILMFVGLLIAHYSSALYESAKTIGILYTVLSLIAIGSLGILVCFNNIIRLLCIRSNRNNQERIRLSFKEMPLWCKICYVAILVLLPFYLGFMIASLRHPELIAIRMVFTVLFIIADLTITVYLIRSKKKK